MIDCNWSWNLNQQNPLVCCSSWQQLFPVSQLGIQHCSCGGLWIFGSGLKVLVHAEAWRGDQGSWRHLQLSKFDFWTRQKQLFWAHLAWTAILAPVTASSLAWMSNGLHHMAMIWPITGAIAIETKVDVYLNKLGWCFLFNPNSSVMLNRLSFFLQLCIKWKDVNGRSHSVSRKQKLTPGYKVRKNSFVPYSLNSPLDTRLERIFSSFILCLFFLITVIFCRALALGDKLVTLSSFPCLLLFKLLRFSRMWWLLLFGSFCTFCRTMAFARPSLSFIMSICTTSTFWTKERTRKNIWNFFKDSGELKNKSIWWQKRNQKNNKDELFLFTDHFLCVWLQDVLFEWNEKRWRDFSGFHQQSE